MTPHDRLEQSMWDLFWLPDDVTVVDRPEVLALYTPRPLTYLNAVYRTRAHTDELPAVVDRVQTLHVHGESRWLVVDTVETAELESQIAHAGYEATQVHDARITAVADFAPRSDANVDVRRVTDEPGLRDSWHVADAAFDRREQHTDNDVATELAQCAASTARVQRFVAYVDDEPVSAGGVNIYPQLGFGFLWAGGTIPSARGKGAYSAIVAARVACAAARGVEFVGLYARVATSSPIVAAQGFSNAGRMTYWDRRAARA